MKHFGNKVLMITLLSLFMGSWINEAQANWGGPGCCGPSFDNMYMGSSYPIGGGYGGYGASCCDYGYGGYSSVDYFGGYGGYGGCCGNPCASYGCCSTNPVHPCQVSFTARGGVAPIVYADRQKNSVRNYVAVGEAIAAPGSAPGAPPVVTLAENQFVQTQEVRTPKFCDQFNTPWTAGAEIAIGLTCNTEMFIDGNYVQADGRKDDYSVRFRSLNGVLFPDSVVLPEESVRIREKYSDLESYDAHLGFRYYFPRCCGAAFYFGSKVGFRHWNEVKVTSRTATTAIINGETTTVFRNLGRRSYYPDQSVVSGGLQLGLNFCVSKCLSFVIQAEALASGAFKFGKNRNVENLSNSLSPPILGASTDIEARSTLSVPVRKMGTIFVFPVTLGLRLSF